MSYRELLQRYATIEVPMIQRDYAQGRDSEREVRDAFLTALIGALKVPSTERSLPLNLDFIYGSVVGQEQNCFAPLDGQQRLTTLFLVHWYLAWRDDEWPTFAELFQRHGKARFTYSIRPSSIEFFDALVAFRPGQRPETVGSLSTLIADQPWYFLNWRLDPTIQAVLEMLDALHERLADAHGLFERLTDRHNPAITFHLLHLENFGLSDDLYIKMNARGKPLTAFETFKARYEQDLAKQPDDGTRYGLAGVQLPVSEYVSRQMDTSWANLFWQLRDSATDLYDDALMNVLRQIALVTRSPEDTDEYLDDVALLRGTTRQPSYAEFHQRGWLDDAFTKTLIAVFDAWSAAEGSLVPLLPNAAYFDEASYLEEASRGKASLAYYRLIQFMAYTRYIEQREEDISSTRFQAWMRVIRNLAVNSEYNRNIDFRRSAQGVVDLLHHAEDVIVHVASADRATRGFSDVQLGEEKLKAELMLADVRWSPLIVRAEDHGYFRGQVGFLLDFSGAIALRSESSPSEWDSRTHGQLQDAFLRYLTMAELMFGESGLNHLGDYLWQRALLSVGDYLLPSSRNHSFLVDATNDQASWKRLLRGSDSAARPRAMLKHLWDQLTPDDDLARQLETIVGSAVIGEPWRRAFVNCPEAFAYCERHAIRREYGTGSIYLLKRSQLNGAHAELFTYCLHQSLQARAEPEAFRGLTIADYVSVSDTSAEPHFSLTCPVRAHQVQLKLEFESGAFRIEARMVDHAGVGQPLEFLRPLGYADDVGKFIVRVGPDEILDHLQALDTVLGGGPTV